MSITAAELIAIVAVRGAPEAAAKLTAVGGAAESAGAKLATLAIGATVLAGAALVGIGVHAIKMAGDFQQATSQLVTGAGESRKNIDALRTGILRLSVDTATSWQQLTNGMFMVDSAGYTLAKGGLTVLKAAAEGAKAENADLAQTTDVLTTTMHGLHAGVSMAIPIMNSLIATERDGKMHMDDLTQAMKNVLPVSSSLGIHLSDVEGALSTMAMSGDRGASAGTHLAMMFKMLENPASSAAKEMKAMGIDSIKLAETMSKSLPDAFTMIQNAVAQHFTPGSVEYERAIAKILGGSKSGIAGLELLGKNFQYLGQYTRDAAEALRKGGTDVENWDVIQQNFNFKLDAAKNAVDALFITLGTHLLPVFSSILDKMTPMVKGLSDLVDQFAKLISPVKQTAQAMQPVIDMSKPLLDTFDHASGVIKATTRAWTPLLDTFDRAKSTIKDTTQVTKPFLDTFDRASGIIQSTTQAGNQVNPVLQTLYQGMKNVAQGAGDVVRFIQDVASNVQLAAPILAGAAAILTAILVPAMWAFAASTIAATWPFVAFGVAIGGLVALFLQFNPQITTIAGAFQGLAPIIQNTAIALGVFFAPALIKAGVEAVISAGKITYNFIASVLASGFAGWSVVFKIGAYIGSLIATGYQAVVNAGKITYNFIASMIASGRQAIVSAAIITYNFVASLIATGVQAVISAGKLTITFVGGLVSAASQAAISAGVIDASLIPAIAGVGTAAAAAAIPIAALGVIAVATFELIANRAWDFNKQVKTSTGDTVNVAQLRYHQLATGASTDMDNMDNNVSNSASQVKTNVVDAFTTMATQTYAKTNQLSDSAVSIFQNLNGDLISQMQSIDANIIGYWNDVANYIDKHPINGHVVYTTSGGNIGVQQSATTGHNAMGTNFWQGGMTWVGERGPEIINLPRGSQVIPNHQINNVVGSSGQPIQVNINLAGHRVAQVLLPELVQAIRNKTGARI